MTAPVQEKLQSLWVNNYLDIDRSRSSNSSLEAASTVSHPKRDSSLAHFASSSGAHFANPRNAFQSEHPTKDSRPEASTPKLPAKPRSLDLSRHITVATVSPRKNAKAKSTLRPLGLRWRQSTPDLTLHPSGVRTRRQLDLAFKPMEGYSNPSEGNEQWPYSTADQLFYSDPRHDIDTIMGAPWFSPRGVLNTERIKREYCDGSGFLPGGIPFEAISTRDWLDHLALPTEALNAGPYDLIYRVKRRFMRAVLDRLSLTPGGVPIPKRMAFDTWSYRTLGERQYGENIGSLATGVTSAGAAIDDRFHGIRGVRTEAIFWLSSIIPMNFRFQKRNHKVFFNTTVRFERRMRDEKGYLIPYQMLEAEHVAPQHLGRRYIPIPGYWPRIEVPQGFWSELGPSLTYLGSCFRFPDHGIWTVFLTEYTVKAAAFLLWDVYDTWRLWFLPKKLISFMRQLDMSVPLGGKHNDTELKKLLNDIENVDWDSVPPQWSSRASGASRKHLSPGRFDPNAGDFVFYNPWEGKRVTAVEAREGRRAPPPDASVPSSAMEPEGGASVAPSMTLEGDEDDAAVASAITKLAGPVQDIDLEDVEEIDETMEASKPTGEAQAGSATADASESDYIRSLLKVMGCSDEELNAPLAELKELLRNGLQSVRQSRKPGIHKADSRPSSM